MNNRSILRWSNIAVRTLHIVSAGAVFGGILQRASYSDMRGWFLTVILTGLTLLLLEWLHDLHWPHRGKGLLVLCHIIAAAASAFLPFFQVALLWTSLVVGSVGSHMPRRYRHWSILYGPEQRSEDDSRSPL